MNVWDSQEVAEWWDNRFKNSIQSHYHDLSFMDRMNVKKVYCVMHENDVMQWYNDVMRTGDSQSYHELSDNERANMRFVYSSLCIKDHPLGTTKVFADHHTPIHDQTGIAFFIVFMILFFISYLMIVYHSFQ